MNYDRKKVVKQMQSWIGCKEADGSHRPIIDLYNTQKKLPRGYKVKYDDAWCATTVTACFMAVGYSNLIFPECSCNKMIDGLKIMGIWMESDSFIPREGDVIFYDWQDSGVGDCTGQADHVGIVESCDGKNIIVIEGNYSDMVKRRTLQVNGKYIRGFGLPRYESEPVQVKKAEMTKTAQPEVIWNFLKGWIGNNFGVAGLIGNLEAESGLVAINLQNSFNKKLNITDEEYTVVVDEDAYSNFEKDSAGYGLAQWTYWTRKKALKEFAQKHNASIGNLQMQLNFLKKELSENYPVVLNTLKNAKSVQEASDEVLLKFERPADQSDAVRKKRGQLGQKWFDLYSKKAVPTPQPSHVKEVKASKSAQKKESVLAGEYATTANLNMRDGAGTSHKVLTTFPKGQHLFNYGYYSLDSEGVTWLYVQGVMNGVKYTGFVSSKFLVKL